MNDTPMDDTPVNDISLNKAAASATSPNQAALAETADYIAIRRVQNRYADLVTRRAWPELHDLMTPTCPLDLALGDRSMHFDGPGEIGDFIAGSLEQFSFFEFVVLNTVIEIDRASATAAARMWMVELRQGLADGRRTNAFGLYQDRFERDDSTALGWRFTARRYASYSRTAPGDSATDQLVFSPQVVPLDQLGGFA